VEGRALRKLTLVLITKLGDDADAVTKTPADKGIARSLADSSAPVAS
jgi:hypothetical protein